jgi:uncharacterized protein YcaQ
LTSALSANLSAQEARALALRAQAIGPRPRAAGPAALRGLLLRLGNVQLDSVNAVARAQELVPFSRLGSYALGDLHDVVYRRRTMFEYWGHAMSWVPMEDYRYFLPRMERHRSRPRGWWKEVREQHAALYPHVLERIRAEGPLASADFAAERASRGAWWDYKPAKLVLEDLFDQGILMASTRRSGFQRVYDLAERVIPPAVDRTRPSDQEADRHLLLRAARALGLGSLRDLSDYYRHSLSAARPAVSSLVEAGLLLPVRVEGWREPAYAAPELLSGPLRRPRHRPVLLAPFDPLIWERGRAARLFGFEYRIEIYTPEPRRRFGYYVLPLLANGRLIGRVDVRNERASRTLRVPAVHLEAGVAVESSAVAAGLALGDLADFLGAAAIVVERGDPPSLLDPLRRALAGRAGSPPPRHAPCALAGQASDSAPGDRAEEASQ